MTFGLVAALAFAPLAFGAVHAWAYTIVELLLWGVGTIWAVQCLFARGTTSVASLPRIGPYGVVAFLLAAWLVLHLVPLPPGVLRAVAPATHRLLAASLPGWPSGPGYAGLLDAGVAAELTAWRPLALCPFLSRLAMLRWLAYWLAFLVAAYYPWHGGVGAVKRLLHVLICVAVFEATYALLQDATGSDMIYWFHKPRGAQWPSGTYVNRNHLAALLAMVVPVTGCLAFHAGARLRLALGLMRLPRNRAQLARRLSEILASRDLFRCAMYATLTVWILAGLYRSLSRAGFLCPLAAACLLTPPLLSRRTAGDGERRRRVPALAFAVLGGLFVALTVSLPELSARLERANVTGAAAGRSALVRDTLGIIADFPLFGVGPGNFEPSFPAYRSFGGAHLTHAHNDYLELGAEAGVPALALILVLLWGFYRRTGPSIRESAENRVLLWGVLVGVTAFLLHSLVDFNFHIPANALTFAVMAGIAVRLSGFRGRSQEKTGRLLAGRAGAALYLCALAAVFFAGYPVARAETNFRRWYPDSHLTDSWDTPSEKASLDERIERLESLARIVPSHPLVRYRLGIELEQYYQAASGEARTIRTLDRAARHFAAAARAMPQSAAPHFQIGILALAGASGLTSEDAGPAFARAQRLDPYNRRLVRAIARARRSMIMGQAP